MGRFGRKRPEDSNYFNKEVALNELLGAFVSDTATVTQVSDLDTVQTLLVANTDRKAFSIFNNSTAILYVKLGSGASSTDFSFRIVPQGYYESGFFAYTGIITGTWASNQSGEAQITEFE